MKKKKPTKKISKTKSIDSLTPKQAVLLKKLKDNISNGISGKKPIKSKYRILKETGYSDSSARYPKQIIEPIKEHLEDYILMLKDKRKQAISHITKEKLKKSSAYNLASISSMLTKEANLLEGKATERLEGSFSLSALFEQANS